LTRANFDYLAKHAFLRVPIWLFS